ncbi:38K protein [Gynaephora ruoergensis nucleopolyhedrovirus]|nr:38K protein [Gynaephora ruoergensis nucleopolyhedrovirus]
MQCDRWTVLRLRNPFVLRHLLVVNSYRDLRDLQLGHWEMFEFVLFAFNKSDAFCNVNLSTYKVQNFQCPDDMNSIRHSVKTVYKTSALGHTYVINRRIPMYAFLKEWYVQNYLEVFAAKQDSFSWEIPHVIVFDLDSTLITDELDARIRHVAVYDSLIELKKRGCVLVLWSYGNKDHVWHSIDRVGLGDFFDVTICGGYKLAEPSRRITINSKSDLMFVKKSFYSDIEIGDKDSANRNAQLPKSPRVVLYYLRKIGVNYIKSITLVDDLLVNNYSYDFFVHVKKCPEPRNDWEQYHEIIIDNMEKHDGEFEQIYNYKVVN